MGAAATFAFFAGAAVDGPAPASSACEPRRRKKKGGKGGEGEMERGGGNGSPITVRGSPITVRASALGANSRGRRSNGGARKDEKRGRIPTNARGRGPSQEQEQVDRREITRKQGAGQKPRRPRQSARSAAPSSCPTPPESTAKAKCGRGDDDVRSSKLRRRAGTHEREERGASPPLSRSLLPRQSRRGEKKERRAGGRAEKGAPSFSPAFTSRNFSKLSAAAGLTAWRASW